MELSPCSPKVQNTFVAYNCFCIVTVAQLFWLSWRRWKKISHAVRRRNSWVNKMAKTVRTPQQMTTGLVFEECLINETSLYILNSLPVLQLDQANVMKMWTLPRLRYRQIIIIRFSCMQISKLVITPSLIGILFYCQEL